MRAERRIAIALVYLALPLVLFLFGWVQPIIGWPLGVLVLAQIAFVVAGARSGIPLAAPPVLLTLAAAGIWFAFAGLLPIGYSTSDWLKHFPVFNALRDCAGPPTYEGGQMLRYYVGWLLMPATVASWLPAEFGRYLIYGWTVLGLAIALYDERRWPQFIVVTLVFALFSGADVLGQLLPFAPRPAWHAGYDWWSHPVGFALLSTTNVLLWVPQHAIPGWILARTFMDEQLGSKAAPYAGLMFASAAFWSPFVAIGALPFLLRRAIRVRLPSLWNVASILVAGPVIYYLTRDSGQLPMGLTPNHPGFSWWRYGLVLVIEIGPWLALLTFFRRLRTPAVIACVTLAVIPFGTIGVLNDWALRASIPAIAVLAFTAADVAVTHARHWLFAATVALCAMSPLRELWHQSGIRRQPNEWEASIKKDGEHLDLLSFARSDKNFWPQLFAQHPPAVLRSPDVCAVAQETRPR